MALLTVQTVPKGDRPWVAIVDDDLFDRLSRWRWALSHAAQPVPVRTLRLPNGRLTSTTLARDVMGLLPGDPRRVVRVDRTGFDFRRANLRISP